MNNIVAVFGQPDNFRSRITTKRKNIDRKYTLKTIKGKKLQEKARKQQKPY